jgi:large subunit ribosomal protein L29
MSKTVDFQKSIQALSVEDLQARITEDEIRLRKLEFAHAITPLENPMSIRNLRREVARLKTQLRKKTIRGIGNESLAMSNEDYSTPRGSKLEARS